eukprot:jgi/Chlat1/8443/Chrsp80S07855
MRSPPMAVAAALRRTAETLQQARDAMPRFAAIMHTIQSLQQRLRERPKRCREEGEEDRKPSAFWPPCEIAEGEVILISDESEVEESESEMEEGEVREAKRRRLHETVEAPEHAGADERKNAGQSPLLAATLAEVPHSPASLAAGAQAAQRTLRQFEQETDMQPLFEFYDGTSAAVVKEFLSSSTRSSDQELDFASGAPRTVKTVCVLCGIRGDLPPEVDWDPSRLAGTTILPFVAVCCGKADIYCTCAKPDERFVHDLCARMASLAYDNNLEGAFKKVPQALKHAARFACARSACRKKGASVTCATAHCKKIWHWPCVWAEAQEGRAQVQPGVLCASCLQGGAPGVKGEKPIRARTTDELVSSFGKVGVVDLWRTTDVAQLLESKGVLQRKQGYSLQQMLAAFGRLGSQQGVEPTTPAITPNERTDTKAQRELLDPVSHEEVPCEDLHAAVVCEDISGGKEEYAIPCVNSIGTDRPPEFVYIRERVFHKSSKLSTESLRSLFPARGCRCVQDSQSDCSFTGRRGLHDTCGHYKHCVADGQDPRASVYEIDFTDKHRPLGMRGRLPYNRQKKVQLCPRDDFIVECNESCWCDQRCPNRVVQLGIRAQLQVFCTRDKGWGLRTLEFIERGTFVVEYVGEIISHEEASVREVGYNACGLNMLFNVDGNPRDEDEDCPYTIDPTHCGNVARFINHRHALLFGGLNLACDANLVVYNMLVETSNKDLHRIGFFAKRDIRKYAELTYDYGWYAEGASQEPNDAKDGGKGAVPCKCGSAKCRKWLRR